jgi:uncharacterized coiled-coil protein SlyX
MKIETVDDLENIVAEQNDTIVAMGTTVNGLGNLVRAQDQQIKLLTALIDHHHEIFIAHGWATPRPKADCLAN